MVVAGYLSVPVVGFFLFLGFAISGFYFGTQDVGEQKPNATSAEKEMHELFSLIVMGTDAFAGLLLLIYLYEDAPWHKTQMREHAYLSIILAMIMSAPCVMWFDPTHGSVRRNYDQLEHCMMATLIIRISTNLTSQEQLPGFFEHRVRTEWFEKRKPPHSLKGTRMVAQIEDLVAQVLVLQKGSIGKLSHPCFNIVLLGLFIVVEVTTLFPKTTLTRANWVIYVWWTALWICMLSDVIKRWCRIRPRQHEIDTLLKGVVHDKDSAIMRYALWELNLPTLIEVGTPNTIALISDKALKHGQLGVVEKAMVVDALQKQGIKQWKEYQKTVADFLTSCGGEDLTLLKNLIDTGGDYYNLYKLVYEDVTTRKTRQAILQHLREQALPMRRDSAPRQGTRGGIGIKIFSDVDDTLYSSGGHFPAGCDKNFPKKRVYPGCLELFKALDWSFSDAPSCDLVFLSARPHVYKSVSEDHSYEGFRHLVKEKRLHSLPTLLPGNLARGTCATLTYCCRKTRAWKRVGEYKYTSFKKYAQLYLEYDYIFCGDNGQGDLLAGQHMVADSVEISESDSEDAGERINPNPRVLAVLIHDVMPEEKVLALEPPAPKSRGSTWRDALYKKRIFMHRTYLGAAAHLYEACPGLLSSQSLQKIATEAVEHFEADVRYCEWKGDWAYYEGAMREDLERVSRLLAKSGMRVREIGDVPALTGALSHSRISLCSHVSIDSDGSEGPDAKLLRR